MFESVSSIRQEFDTLINTIEKTLLYLFVIEYFLRLWSITSIKKFKHPITGRLKFIFTPFAIIDFLAISPFFLPFIGLNMSVVRIFRFFRIFRLFKAGRYFTSSLKIVEVIKAKRKELIATLIGIIFLIIITSTLMYYAEGTVQPEAFSSIPASFWWSIVTLTTIGYGDVYPITITGKIMAGIIALLGVGFVSIPSGIIAGGFTENIMHKKEGILEKTNFANHVIICGWSHLCSDIIENLLNKKSYIETIIVLAQLNEIPAELVRLQNRSESEKIVTFISGNPSKIEDLEKINIRQSNSVIIVGDSSKSSPETLLIAAAVESIDPQIYTSALIQSAELKETFKSISDKFSIDEIICTDEVASYIAVNSTINKGSYKVFNEIFDFGIGNNMYKLHFNEISHKTRELTYLEMSNHLLKHKVKLLAVENDQKSIMITPESDYVMTENDSIFVIAEDLPKHI